jgi:hypothetical protein
MLPLRAFRALQVCGSRPHRPSVRNAKQGFGWIRLYLSSTSYETSPRVRSQSRASQPLWRRETPKEAGSRSLPDGRRRRSTQACHPPRRHVRPQPFAWVQPPALQRATEPLASSHGGKRLTGGMASTLGGPVVLCRHDCQPATLGDCLLELGIRDVFAAEDDPRTQVLELP